jgi:hypothetical protein
MKRGTSSFSESERRIDLIEYIRICHVLEVDPCEGLHLVCNAIENP